jgi:hypothetical protein
MSGARNLLPLDAIMAWTETTLTFNFNEFWESKVAETFVVNFVEGGSLETVCSNVVLMA